MMSLTFQAERAAAFLVEVCRALDEGLRPATWMCWMAAGCVPIALGSCGGKVEATTEPSAGAGGHPSEACENEADDDGDGMIDCEDVDCVSSAACGARYGIPYDAGP